MYKCSVKNCNGDAKMKYGYCDECKKGLYPQKKLTIEKMQLTLKTWADESHQKRLKEQANAISSIFY